MKIKPLNDRVLVLRIDEEEKTSGGIIIPDTAKEKPQEGKVIAVGKGKLDDEGKRIPLRHDLTWKTTTGQEQQVDILAFQGEDRSAVWSTGRTLEGRRNSCSDGIIIWK